MAYNNKLYFEQSVQNEILTNQNTISLTAAQDHHGLIGLVAFVTSGNNVAYC